MKSFEKIRKKIEEATNSIIITLSWFKLKNESITDLFNLLKEKSIKTVDCSYIFDNKFSKEEKEIFVEKICDLIENSNIEYIDLSFNYLKPNHLSKIINSLRKNSTLKEIDFFYNSEDIKNTEMISKFFGNSRNVKKLLSTYPILKQIR